MATISRQLESVSSEFDEVVGGASTDFRDEGG